MLYRLLSNQQFNNTIFSQFQNQNTGLFVVSLLSCGDGNGQIDI